MTDNTAGLPTTAELRDRARTSLAQIGVTVVEGDDFHARSPITGDDLFGLRATTPDEADAAVAAAAAAFQTWRTTPAPVRGELVRTLGELLRRHSPTSPTSSPSRPGRSAPRPSGRSRR